MSMSITPGTPVTCEPAVTQMTETVFTTVYETQFLAANEESTWDALYTIHEVVTGRPEDFSLGELPPCFVETTVFCETCEEQELIITAPVAAPTGELRIEGNGIVVEGATCDAPPAGAGEGEAPPPPADVAVVDEEVIEEGEEVVAGEEGIIVEEEEEEFVEEMNSTIEEIPQTSHAIDSDDRDEISGAKSPPGAEDDEPLESPEEHEDFVGEEEAEEEFTAALAPGVITKGLGVMAIHALAVAAWNMV